MSKRYNGPVQWITTTSNEEGIRMRKAPTLTVTVTKPQLRALEKLRTADPALPSMSYMIRKAINLLLASKAVTEVDQ